MNANDLHPPTVRRWISLILLGLALFLSVVDRQILTVLVDPIKKDIGITETQFGLLQGFAFGVFYTVLGIPVAVLADRWVRKIIIGTGLVVWSTATCLAGFARSYGVLFTARIGVGLGEACLAPAAFSMCADWFGPRLLGRALGVFHAIGALGFAGAAAIGASLFGHFSASGGMDVFDYHVPPWGMTLVAVGVPGIILGLIVFAFVREPVRVANPLTPPVNAGERPPLVPALLAERGFLLRLLLAIGILSIASNGFLTWVPAYLQRVFSVTPVQLAALLGTTLGVGALLGPLIGGGLSDWLYKRIGRRAPIALMMIFALVFAVCCAMIPFADTVRGAGTLVALISLVFPTVLTLSAIAIQLETPAVLRAQVSAIYLCLNTLMGMGLGSLFVAMTTQYLFESATQVGKSIALVGVGASIPGLLLVATLLGRRAGAPQAATAPSPPA